MCTSISFKTKNHYFGRNLDLEYSFNEAVTVTPRNFPFQFRETKTFRSHFAMIGMATIIDDYPLYYDATNEYGLSMAGLNFPGNAVYLPPAEGKDNVTPFEFIPWVLGQCRTVQEAKALLHKINLVNIPFQETLPLSPLHWIIADRESTIVAEPLETGLQIYDDPIGLLTNNPPYPYHLQHLTEFMNLSAQDPTAGFAPGLQQKLYCSGLGAHGLPGDVSSPSRYIRAAFTKLNSVCEDKEMPSVHQFFHILDSVAMHRGCCMTNGAWDITFYSSCCNTDTGVYYYKTYDNFQLTAVDMYKENLDGKCLSVYPLRKSGQVFWEN